MNEVLRTEKLGVHFYDGSFCLQPVDIILEQGEILAIIGESGSGKSTLAKALTGLNAENAKVEGTVLICGKNLYQISEKERKQMRMRQFSIAMQASREWLNPMLSIYNQLKEILVKEYKKDEIDRRIKELTVLTGYPYDALKKYPSELSGGMIQKVLIMSAIALKPQVVILDEPTSALDTESAAGIQRMVREIRRKEDTAFLIITHDLYLAHEVSDRIMVFYRGMLVEEGKTKSLFASPRHPYTKGLFRSSMDINIYRDIWGIQRSRSGEEQAGEGCPFFSRCHQCLPSCKTHKPVLKSLEQDSHWRLACNRGGIVKVLEGRKISKSYGKDCILNQAEVYVESAEVVALVGPSGCGKSTLAHILSGIVKPNQGEVLYEQERADYKVLHRIEGGMQIVRQDPDAALNPEMTVRDAVVEPLILNRKDVDCEQEATELLNAVGLPVDKEMLNSRIRRLSGGQKQKVVIARALALKPRLLIADEITSMLDASSKANLLRLLKGIQNSRGLAMLFITHDQAAARKISDRIYEFEEGKLRERGRD